MKKRPNIVLIIADDHRASALGCAGVEAVSTPCLDRLAQCGTRFTRAHHMGSPHGAVCAPSRAMLMTGIPYFQLDQRLLHEGRSSTPLPPTLPGLLRTHGYHTFATGKWHNGSEMFHASFDSGANLFFGGMGDHWFITVHDFDPTGRYPAEDIRVADGFSTEVFAGSAIDFIRSRKGNDQPFFCYCAFNAPHDPRTPPDAYRRLYNPGKIELPPNVVVNRTYDLHSRGVGRPPELESVLVRDELLLGDPRDPNDLRRAIAEYYGMISHMDEWIGRIHQAVEELGEDTIILHTADHGLAVGQHGLLGKQNLFNHSVTVPLIMAGPGVPAGREDQRLCYQHDLNPTLLEMAGVPASDGCVFRNLFASEERSCIGTAYTDTQRMIRNERYKLIEYRTPDRHTQLFDLLEDPWETRNLSQEAEMQGIVDELRKRLVEWQVAAGDSLRM